MKAATGFWETTAMRFHTICAIAALALGTGMGSQAATPGNITAAVADPSRPAAERDLDAARKPAETLAFIGLKPGQKVVDLVPGRDRYFVKLFLAAVGPKGKVYGFLPSELGAAGLKITLPANGAVPDPTHPNFSFLVSPVNAFTIPEPVDVVWIRQNYHDLYDPFMGPADVPALNKAVFKALKPGGVFVILDHSAPDGSGIASTNTTHRIDATRVKADMKAAGFVFAGESTILRNPADPRTALVFDASIHGKTDQFLFKFRKPK